MACKRLGTSEQDPDYENIDLYHAKRMRILEQDAKEASIKKISTIITTQFNKATMEKEEELNCINQHLHQARAIMDKVRAYAVARYYGSTEKFPNDQGHNLPQRFHPAIKSLLVGKKPKPVETEADYLSNHLSSNNSLDSSSNDQSVDNSCNWSAKSHDNLKNDASLIATNHQDNKSDSKANESIESSRASRFKISKKIIVGNVSKFIPPDKREGNDLATHKWMVYVRGPKEEPSIDHFVKKVWFFLHPSYRPNDFIEISKPPFHLTRRGWGEFPVRVQIHFHDSRNKRIDVVHMLKVVTVFLFKLETLAKSQPEESESSLLNIKSETFKGNYSLEFVNTERISVEEEIKTKTFLSDEENKEETISNFPPAVQEEVEVTCDVKPSETPVDEHLLTEQTTSLIPQSETVERLSSSAIINKVKSSNSLLESSQLNTTISHTGAHEELVDNEKPILMPSNYSSHNILTNKLIRNHFSCTNSVLESNKLTGQNVVSESASLPYKPIVSDKCHSTSGISLLRNNRLSNSVKINKPVTSSSGQLVSSLPFPKVNSIGKSLISSSLSLLSSASTNKMGKKFEGNNPNSLANSVNLSSVLTQPLSSTSSSSILLVPSVSKLNSAMQPADVSSIQKNSSQSVIKNLPEKLPTMQPSTKLSLHGSTTVVKPQNIPNNNVLTYIKCGDKIFLVPQNALIKSATAVDGTLNPSNNSKSGNIQASGNITSSNLESIASSHVSPVTASAQVSQSSPMYLLQLVPSTTGTTNQAQLIQLPQPTTKPSPLIYSKDRGKTIKQVTLQNSSEILKQERISFDVETGSSSIGPKSIKVDDCQSMKEVLKQFLKYFPLICENADKAVHPYCAPSFTKYMSWCIGKQRAAEWQRARAVRLAILEAFGVSERWKESKVWSTKAILLWCRQYGYTPFKDDTQTEVSEESNTDTRELNTYSDSVELLKKLKESSLSNGIKIEEMSDSEEIDIETVEIPTSRKCNSTVQDKIPSKLFIYHPMSLDAEYVNEESAKIGVKLKPVEIYPGVMMPVVEEILFRISKLFAEDLLRNSLACSFKRQEGKRCCNSILLEDVHQCIKDQPEFRFLTNEYLGKNITIPHEKEKS